MDTQDYRIKLLQVFRYLQSYHSLKNPICKDLSKYEWSLWLDDFPEHETIAWNHAAPSGEENIDFDEDFIVKIRRPVADSCPEPPPQIRERLADGWRDPDSRAELRPNQEASLFAPQTAAENYLKEAFADQPERTALYREWDAKREKWRLQQLKYRQVLAIYDKFYHLYSQLKREAEQVELVLTDGILKAQTLKGELIQHPLMAQRVELLFDADRPEFKIVAADRKPEFNSDLLRQISRINTDALGECRSEFETQIDYLYDNDSRENTFLNSLAARLEPVGRFTTDREEFNHINEAVAILKRPVLLLRRRTMGFDSFLEQIVTDITKGGELPAPLANILGFETGPFRQPDPEPTDFRAVNGESETVLFAKEANLEQLQIVQKLEKSGAVLVQGPPGTGKTHTIANLIGHFLAHGQTVLVTSHTSKALRVLKDKIVPALRALCVTVFNEEHEQLERCVETITDVIATNSPEALLKEAEKLSALRSEIYTCRLEAQKDLVELRQGEYRPIAVGEQDYAVKTAAQIVAAGRGVNDWIPSPVRMGSALPLTPSELARLYRTNLTLTVEDETELRLPLPDVVELWPPEEVKRLLAELEPGENVQSREQADYWTAERKNDVTAFSALLVQISKAGSDLKAERLWEWNARAAGFLDANCRRPWETLIENIRVAFKQNAAYQTVWIDYEPYIPAEMISEATRDDLAEIITYLQDGKKINFLALLHHGGWKEIIIKLRVKGAIPSTIEHFQYLYQGIQLELAREALKQRWRKLITEAGGPEIETFGDAPERGMWHYLDKISSLLNWHTQQWLPVEQQLTLLGFAWDAFWQDQPPVEADPSGMGRLAAACGELEQVLHIQLNRLRAAEIQKQLKLKAEVLDQYRNSNGMSSATRKLQMALEKGDASLYRQTYQRVRHLAAKYADWKARQNSLKKLAPMAPVWAEAIRNRAGKHGLGQLPGDPALAWEWRQLHDELELRNRENPNQLQQRLDQLNQRLRQVTACLIEKRTWAKICNISMPQRQALIGWKELLKKMGKRTGSRAPILLEEARKLMPQCQAAVPVWIMPLARVAENFTPGVNRFDVVIIDEASQSDSLALAALYLGKQVVVVGDDQQVSPDAVGQNQAEIQNLLNDYLRDIPNRQLYDGQSSVYDLAKCSFDPVCLKEHFRCVAPIIEFSNRLSYAGRIRPLRDASAVALKPSTVAYRVSDGVTHNQLNQAESETVAALLTACLEQPEYAAATFGVISLLGTGQAVAIDAILRRRLPEKEYAKRQILCGNPAQFQGDERDVIFISVVDSSGGAGPLNLRSFGAQEMYRKRYNVAASRARDQLWVVYSLDPDTDLKPDDLRLSLIKHARNPEAFTPSEATAQARPLSAMERAVLETLTQKGYQVVPQWKAGTYRIDLVVVDRDQKVAVECDGEKYHTEATLSADLARQAVLERLGWRFIRIRCSQFYCDPEKTLAGVMAQLQAYQVYPVAPAAAGPAVENSLLERVIRRAVELRREWNVPQATAAGQTVGNGLAWEDEPEVELAAYFDAKGVETIDLRPKGGDLWIVADAASATVIEKLKEAGYRFKYYQNGVNASGNRAAWCLAGG
jgi:very-short-patch-repair endonuclease